MKKIIIYICFVISIGLSSCSDWLTIQPENALSKDEMFESKSGFYDALYGVYTECDNNYGHNGNLTTYTIEHLAAQWDVKSESNEEKMRSHDYKNLDSDLSLIFGNQYRVIANINLILEYLESQNFLKKEDYKQIKGECLGLRAWLHFDLIRLWGPVPSKINKGRNYLAYVTKFTNSWHTYHTYDSFMEMLTNDMTEAEELLTDLPIEKNYRLNILGVKALLSRISLWQENKEYALKYANEVISIADSLTDINGKQSYALGDLNSIGSKDYTFSREHLFGRYDDFESTPFRNILYNTVSHLNSLYEFSASDIRYMQWEDRKEDGMEAPAMNLLKYISKKGSVSIIRLAEVFFIAMECGDLSLANTLYEKFCAARGISYSSINNNKQLQDILYKEYRKEFIGEGVMFYYYKRHYITKIPRNTNNCDEGCYVLPLPKKEIDVNM